MENELFVGSERFCLRKMQVANWGTFQGIHTIDISEKGHLFVGGSGSGKSTLLDAISVLLTPRRINFNAAARQGTKRSDRSLMTYVRGAWSSEQDMEGKAVSKFLRENSTWSGISLTYESNFGRIVTLLYVCIVKGNTREESKFRSGSHYFVISGDFNMIDLADISVHLDIKAVKAKYSEAQKFDTFPPYGELFCKIFGIRDERVLFLLQKAQSAKSLEDINQFFREFMLDEPKTFEQAALLVENFSKLQEAYEEVKRARLQVECLGAARKAFEALENARETIARCDRREQLLEPWENYWRKKLLEALIPRLEVEYRKLKEKYEVADQKHKIVVAEIENLKIAISQSGGEVLFRLEMQLKQAQGNLAEAERRFNKIKGFLASANIERPRSPSAWASQILLIQEELATLEKTLTEWEEKRFQLGLENRELDKEIKQLRREIEAMERHPSNIPSYLLDVRDALVQELGLSEQDLPFVGELIQIKEKEAQWQGACERVLHQFALSLLVSERNYPDLARLVDKSHLGIKLVYMRVPNRVPDPEIVEQDSVPTKFDIKSGIWNRWISSELSRRFNYVCIESTAQFPAYEKAVTISGQIKHNRVRHEKDDRRSITDRSAWVTGFDNREKKAEYLRRVLASEEKQKALRQEVKDLEAKGKAGRDRKNNLTMLQSLDWKDFDTATPKAEVKNIEDQLESFKSTHKEYEELQKKLPPLEESVKRAFDEMVDAKAKMQSKEVDIQSRKADLDKVVEAIGGKEPPVEELNDLDILMNKVVQTASYRKPSEGGGTHLVISLDNIGSCSSQMMRRISQERGASQKIEGESSKEMESKFQDFLREWPTMLPQLDATEHSAPEFFQKLDELEKDGLPKFEEKFRNILEEHAQQNLLNLSREIQNEGRTIKTRMQLVNQSLATAVFNRLGDQETHLIIDVKDRKLPEYQEFKDLQNQILARRLEFTGQNAKEAEGYYKLLQTLVSKLDENKPENALWRKRVLDVREHVTFQARELDSESNVIDVYDSGAGKSGGQRQKLTMTCLVAALRYQLGAGEDSMPSYATIVMDEAFDKADSEFTDISMKIFHDFGFQPVIATPEKGLYTLEPYMGSFCFVSCQDRRNSSVIEIEAAPLKDILSKKLPERGETVEVDAFVAKETADGQVSL